MPSQIETTINQKLNLKRSHKVGITVFLVVKVLLIISVVYLSISLVTVKTELQLEINSLKTELNEKLTDSQQITQGQINELRDNIQTTEEGLTEQFNELKAHASSDFSGIIEETTSGVVNVRTDVSQGSGFLISEDGYIVTNAHVLAGGSYAEVLIYDTSRWKSADLIGYDLDMDIAVLDISGSYEHLEFANSNKLKVGEKTIAIGNPLGLSFTVTEGIISALEREGPNGIPAYIQIDTPLNSGNSGGPLINTEGEVIGINNFKIKGGENLGFSLESNYAITSINKIFESKNLSEII
ncbi:MAG: trypsin-like peptidase domain-containing protein [Nanoarchaeota archaeon]|nr:trypsin-like peptidase domain-containing protein [Nanoarchaeota archaeon]